MATIGRKRAYTPPSGASPKETAMVWLDDHLLVNSLVFL